MESAIVIGGLSALGAGLYSIGIPKDSIVKYEKEIRTGKFLLIAQGTTEEVANIQSAIAKTGSVQTDIHEADPVATK